jgi:hypothetical protein
VHVVYSPSPLVGYWHIRTSTILRTECACTLHLTLKSRHLPLIEKVHAWNFRFMGANGNLHPCNQERSMVTLHLLQVVLGLPAMAYFLGGLLFRDPCLEYISITTPGSTSFLCRVTSPLGSSLSTTRVWPSGQVSSMASSLRIGERRVNEQG